MDETQSIPRIPRPRLAAALANAQTEADGRAVAIGLLEAAKRENADDASIEAKYRRGRSQNVFAAPFIAAINGRPRALEGFASVLSDFLSSCGGADPEVYVLADRGLVRRERRASGTLNEVEVPHG